MKTDVIVIGGGLIGSSITYYLSKAGKKVLQIEKDYFSAGASGSCDQMVIAQSKAPNEHLTLALHSIEMYKNLTAELSQDIEYHQPGAVILIENDTELEIMTEIVKKQRALGLDVNIVDKQDAKKLQRGISTEQIVAATYSTADGRVNPFKVNLAFSKAAHKLGAQLMPFTPAEDLITENGKVVGVKTPSGDFYADIVINAAGAWAPQIASKIGLNIPIKPRRGQVYITEAVPRYIEKGVLNARYIVAKHNPQTLAGDNSAAAKLGIGIAVTQSQKGNILFGSTREFTGYNVQNTEEGLRELLANAVRLMPGLENMNIIRAMGGVRPYPPDSKPLVGFVDGVEGFFMAAGHEGDGICLAPVTGKIVADLIVNGKSELPAVQSLNPNRFDLKG